MTNDNRYEGILASCGEKEVHSMCEVADRLEQKGKAEGKMEIIHNMLSKGLGIDEIADFTGVDVSFVQEVAKKG